MSRNQLVLLVVIVAELAVAGSAAYRRARQERPPLPSLARLDATTAAEVIELRERVQPDDPTTWQTLGDVYLAFGYFAEAEACYARAAHAGPASHDLLLRWGVCLDRLGRLPQAIAKYELAANAAEDGRRREVCQYHIARCYLRDLRTDYALEALLLAGDFELAQYELARLQTRIGRPDAAAPILDRLLTRLPDELKLNLLRAKVAEALGDPVGARRWLERAERSQDRLFVDSTVEYVGLLRVQHGLPRQRARGVELESAGQFAQAADALDAAQKLEWDLTTARTLVRLDFRLGRIEQAAAVVQEMVARFGEYPEFLEQLGDAAFLQQRPDDAAALWQRAVDLRPSARLHQLLAEHCAQAGMPDTAAEHRAAAEHYGGLESYRSNQLPRAVERLARAVELQPTRAEWWYCLGLAQQASDDPASARTSYARCLELQPYHGRALDALNRLSMAAPVQTP